MTDRELDELPNHQIDAVYALKQLKGIDANTIVGRMTYDRIQRAIDAIERIVGDSRNVPTDAQMQDMIDQMAADGPYGRIE